MANDPKKDKPTADQKSEEPTLKDLSDQIKAALKTQDKSAALLEFQKSILKTKLTTNPSFMKITWPTLSPLDLGQSSLKKLLDLGDQIVSLQRQVEEQTKALGQEKNNAQKYEQQFTELQKTYSDLMKKQQLGFMLNCVNQDGQRALLESEEFRQLFLEKRELPAIVMSVDIRRSTELMLKARTPESFASFITELCAGLMSIIKDRYGVIDKFTGDGVLAFFPDFYSGPDAAYYAVSAAQDCHSAFRREYEENRSSFKSILTDVGLGIGIDFGMVQLVQVAGGLTVVGEPVVYACRLSGAPAGSTLLNQPAFEELTARFSGSCYITETSLEIKHEGRMLAYEVKLNNTVAKPKIPDWVQKTGSVDGSGDQAT